MVVEVDSRRSAGSTLHGNAALELSGILARLRWRLGLEQALILAVRGVFVSGLTLVAAAALTWLFGGSEVLFWVGAAPLLGAIGVTLARWPSRLDTAVVADARLGLDDRLATSVELLQRSSEGRFDRLQLDDAVLRARVVPTTWLALTPSIRLQAILSTAVLVLGAVAMVLLPSAPRPLVAGDPEPPPQVELALQGDLVVQSFSDEAAPTVAQAVDQPLQRTPADTSLASRVQQEQAARSALDNLAKALGSISAGQAAADAIEQGDFAAAREQLQNLGEEADQLSDAAKQQLSKALQQAAAATVQTDRQLADRERQAAQALSKPGYTEQRQALRNLAEQVQRSGSRSVPSDQLQHELGQLGQQSGGPGVRPLDAQQGGPGIGSAPGPSPLGDDASRLDTAGQAIPVPTKLSGGPGVRPLDGSEDQLSTDPSLTSRNVAELARPQLTGQVKPEQNLVPGEQRPVVRGYFR